MGAISDDPRTAVAVRMAGRADAEGFPTPASWEVAPSVRFEADWQGKNADPERETEVRMLWTSDTLYLRFRAKYRAITVFSDAEANGRRDQLWDRDVAEVFLQPNPAKPRRYKEFEVSPNGMWIDLEIAPGKKHDLKSRLRRRVVVNGVGKTWIAELALPMKCLVEKFDAAAIWRVNFYRVDSGVARMTLSRPEHNLLNEAMLRELADGIVHAGEQSAVKLIVLDSACKVFCGGIDIGEYTSQRVFQMLDAFHAVFSAMLEVGKPVVCVVNGPAIGGGAELAAFGDLVIATPKARFAQPEISIGIFPPLASTILPYLVGPKVALELVLTGEPVTAERALELGMINRLVPEAQLEQTVTDLVNRINSHSGPVLMMAKKAILGGMGLSLRDGLKQSMSIFLNELYRLDDSQEGLRAIIEKRKPNWKNR